MGQHTKADHVEICGDNSNNHLHLPRKQNRSNNQSYICNNNGPLPTMEKRLLHRKIQEKKIQKILQELKFIIKELL